MLKHEYYFKEKQRHDTKIQNSCNQWPKKPKLYGKYSQPIPEKSFR